MDRASHEPDGGDTSPGISRGARGLSWVRCHNLEKSACELGALWKTVGRSRGERVVSARTAIMCEPQTSPSWNTTLALSADAVGSATGRPATP
jgi:hypothetical protein